MQSQLHLQSVSEKVIFPPICNKEDFDEQSKHQYVKNFIG